MVNASRINSNMNFRGQNLERAKFLEEKLEGIDDKQGILGNIWNGVKEITTLGVSKSDCESMLEKYNNGEISFEEAVNYLDEFDSKQETMSGLLSNILTGAAAIAMVTPLGASAKGVTKTINWALAFAKGAPVGAIAKTGINLIDRATNDVEGDALDAKQMAKDAISGAITGTTSAVSGASSLGYKSLVDSGKITGDLAKNVAKGVLCGTQCGALSGSTSYMTDVAFGDKEFNFGDLAENTLTSATISGVVGGTVGAGMYGLDKLNIGQVTTEAGQIVKDSSSSTARKIGGTKLRQIFGL